MTQRRHKTDYIVIHCSDTKPGMDVDAAEIDRWHRKRGFLEIGYQFVVLPDGRVELGRDLQAPGAHARKVNSISVGVCMIGGQDAAGKPSAEYTPQQWRSLQLTVRTLKLVWPDAEVVGHEDVDDKGKTCPNFDAKRWWQGVMEDIDR